MIKKWFLHQNKQQANAEREEEGQSIVILAFVFIGLLAFVGIAVDVGLVFARATQLQSGIDAAALAGVTELADGDLNDADNRAAQFLRANGIPISVTQTIVSDRDVNSLDGVEYSVTGTWPVELFFLRLIGLEEVNVTRSATAAYFPLADIFTGRRSEYGFIETANQSVFGPNICTSYGDSFSPLNSVWAPGEYTWKYRIYIPPDYNHDIVRVELFDPDSINTAENSHTVFFSATAIQYSLDNDPPDNRRFPAEGKVLNCQEHSVGGNPHQRWQPCVLRTGELDILEEDDSISLDQINPYWFVRIDENRGAGAGHGNGTCGTPSVYTPRYNTQTVFELFYYRQESDGTITRIPLASYTGQVDDGIRGGGDHMTDMRWVSPRPGPQPYDDYVDENGNPIVVPADFGSFDISLSSIPDILEDPATGARYIYLDITSLSGASENGYSIWAGPPNDNRASDVNTRNLNLVESPAAASAHFSQGVTVFAMGNLPMNSIYSQPVDIPLVYIGPEMAGQRVFVSLFDPDAGTQPPIAFFFDSIAFQPTTGNTVGVNWNQTDWGFLYGDATDPNPDGRCFHVSVSGNNRCTNQWIDPSYGLTIPGDVSRCDYGHLATLTPGTAEYRQYLMDNCTPFYGGRLHARYASNFADTYGWEIRLEGIPYLVR